jgi:PrtD family type I secretion system ABC transporter
MTAANPNMPMRNPVAAALSACTGAFVSVGVFSALLNILMLAGPLFMLQVYDRVLVSGSMPTLFGLLGMLLLAYGFQVAFDIIRGRIVVRAAELVDRSLEPYAHKALVESALGHPQGAYALRDLDQIRGFFTGGGPAAFADLPWLPLFMVMCFIIHPWLGVTAFAGGLVLFAVAVATEIFGRKSAKAVMEETGVRGELVEASRRNGEVVRALGMAPALRRRFSVTNDKYLGAIHAAANLAGGMGSVSRVLRLLLQSVVLAVGATLVVAGELSGGGMIASSILVSRAVAPIEGVIANWRGLLGARLAHQRLTRTLTTVAAAAPVATQLPAPRKSIELSDVAVAAPGAKSAIVSRINFAIPAGQAVAVIGPSGSGKSSLSRVLTGIWRPANGEVRLDGATLDQYNFETLGRHIGYVPQSIELFAGSVAENIARMDIEPDSASVLAAAKAAGAHEMILGLPAGYDTGIADAGVSLSGGQRQRIALARALYGNPFLLVLDEPNSNLDADGENALITAVANAKARGAAVLIVTHRPSLTATCENILFIAEGTQRAFGPREEILRRLEAPAARANPPAGVKVVNPSFSGAQA